MTKLKRISMVCFIVFFILSLKVFAVGEEITYDGITISMPEIVDSEEYEGEDPADLKAEKNNVDSFLTQKGSFNINSSVGASAKPDESISTLINRFAKNNTVVGIDISAHQADIDWEKVANSGVKFAMIRCGFRGWGSSGTLVKDTYFDKNIEGALSNGIYVGVYFYSTALNEEEALQEAALTYEAIKNYNLKYPVAYDYEEFDVDNSHRTANLSNDQLHKNAKTFLNYIKSKGYTASLYGSADPLKNTWKMSEFTAYDTWVAHYYVDQPNYDGAYQMWQYTDNATVSGISTRVDVDVDYSYWAGMKIAAALNFKSKGWNKTDNGDWFYLTDEGLIAIGWKYIGGKWYYFDTNTGAMLSNCSKKILGKVYVFNSSGAMVTYSGWFSQIDSHTQQKYWYYMNGSTALIGWLTYNNEKYYLSEKDGKMVSNGPIYIENGVYWFDSEGRWILHENGWQNENGKWYYVENGIGIVGWKYLDKAWYYLDTGVMASGWRQIKNTWYYFKNNGTMVSSNYILIGSKTYCFDSSGAMASNGWFKYNNDWFYLRADGSAVKNGWMFIKNIWYYFDGEGKMLSNTTRTINGKIYGFDASGALIKNRWVKTSDLKWYYFGSNGEQVAKTGWQWIDGNWYYLTTKDGKIVANGSIYDGKGIYWFDSEGKWILHENGWQNENGKWYYVENGIGIVGWKYLDKTWYYLDKGVMASGWRQIKNSWYYFKNNGTMVSSNWMLIKNVWYYFEADGAMFNGKERKINGKVHLFNSSGAWIGEK